MESHERITYLANLMSVVRADNEVHPAEELAVEGVRQQIKATKTKLKKAMIAAEVEDFEITPVGRYSDRIRNVEDMLYIAMCDGDFASWEKPLVISFVKRIGLTQEQANLIVSEVKNMLAGDGTETVCGTCGKKTLRNAKFCPECGTDMKVTRNEGTQKLGYDVPREGISIEFAESSSAQFDFALKASRSAPSFLECVRSGKKWFCATWPKTQMPKVLKLVKGLKGMRNRKVYVDGKHLPWEEVFAFTWCFTRRDQAYSPREYCFGSEDKNLNVWGCMQSQMNWQG